MQLSFRSRVRSVASRFDRLDFGVCIRAKFKSSYPAQGDDQTAKKTTTSKTTHAAKRKRHHRARARCSS